MIQFGNAGFHNGKRLLRVTQDLRCITSLGVLIVPRHFVFDGASIPKIAQNICGPFDEYLEDTALHDWFYSPNNTEYTRKEADDVLKETMWNRGFSRWKIEAFHLAVRTCGWKHFKGNPQ